MSKELYLPLMFNLHINLTPFYLKHLNLFPAAKTSFKLTYPFSKPLKWIVHIIINIKVHNNCTATIQTAPGWDSNMCGNIPVSVRMKDQYLNPLPDDKNFDYFQLKQTANDILKCI